VIRTIALCVLAATSLIVAACAGSRPRSETLYDPRALPTGPLGLAIAYGHAIVVDTPHLMKGYVRAKMTCAACHVDAGTKQRGGSFIGTYGRFPQWNKRAHRVIGLQDRLAECFLYSMNGRPPAYNSPAMIAMVSYIAWLSRGIPVGTPVKPSDRFIQPLPKRSPDIAHGADIYTRTCVVCHQINGAGINGAFPPLWGDGSFNDGAGMAHIDRMTGFVRYNMPKSKPGTLSLDEAYDVAAFVLHHHRPHFHRNVPVVESPRPAGYF
jgi:thiosulfate dehydrogenase